MPKRRVKRHAVTQPLDQSYRLIPLTQGQNAIVDAVDFDWLNQWNWYAVWSPGMQNFYAKRKSNIWMHRKILGLNNISQEVDHANHDTLDNRRKNIRACTGEQNQRNGRRRSDNTSGYRGVCWHLGNDHWTVQISVSGKRIRRAGFKSAEEAARVYDELAKIHHGQFAHLNFPLTATE